MFYILRCDELGKRYSVVDTADGVVECYTPEQLVQFHLQGIRIDGVEFTEKEISVGVTKNLDFICFSKTVSNYVKDTIAQIDGGCGWISMDTSLNTAGFRVSDSILAYAKDSLFFFLCEINGKVYMYSSLFDDFFDLSHEIKHLSGVQDVWLVGIPLSIYRGPWFARFKILYENDFVGVELSYPYIKFEVERSGLVYKIQR